LGVYTEWEPFEVKQAVEEWGYSDEPCGSSGAVDGADEASASASE
jgi:hypothetical protein